MEKKLVKKYLPYLLINKKEPFLPKKVGYSIFTKTTESPSFKRMIKIDKQKVDFVIEYAIYWDYDIQRLYDLEHVWIYIDKEGQVVDCEVSFHGRYLKGLKADQSNRLGNHVLLYCQAGKHAFAPYHEVFEVLPNYIEAASTTRRDEGLLVTDILKGKIMTSELINQKVNEKLAQYKFMPSNEYWMYEIEEDQLTTWGQLHEDIVAFIHEEIIDILNS